MRKMITAVLIAIVSMMGAATVADAQLHQTKSLVVNLDLELDKSELGDTELQVRVHAQDRAIDTYFASPIDLSDDEIIVWQQELPLMVDNNMPLLLVFELYTENGYPLPRDYRVEAQYSVNGSSYVDLISNTLTVPAGYSGEADLSIRATIIPR